MNSPPFKMTGQQVVDALFARGVAKNTALFYVLGTRDRLDHLMRLLPDPDMVALELIEAGDVERFADTHQGADIAGLPVFFSSAQMSDPDPSAADDLSRINNLTLLALRSPVHVLNPQPGPMEKLAANLTELRDAAAKARRRSPEHRKLYETLCLAAGHAQSTAQATEELVALLNEAHAAALPLCTKDDNPAAPKAKSPPPKPENPTGTEDKCGACGIGEIHSNDLCAGCFEALDAYLTAGPK